MHRLPASDLVDRRQADLLPVEYYHVVVNAKRPFTGPSAVLAYVSRYTHRVAISNSRLLALDERGVTFRWKDSRANGNTRYKAMTLNQDGPQQLRARPLPWVNFAAGRPGVPKVSFLACRPIHTAGQFLSLDAARRLTAKGGKAEFRRTSGPDLVKPAMTWPRMPANPPTGPWALADLMDGCLLYHLTGL